MINSVFGSAAIVSFIFLQCHYTCRIQYLEDQKRQEETPLDCKLLLGLMGVIGRDNTDTATSFGIPLTFPPFSFLNFHWNSSSASHLSHILFSVFQLKLETFLISLNNLNEMVPKLLLLFLLFESTVSLSHPNVSNGVVVTEKAYLKWVKQMGSFKHSLFQKAVNKFKPCLTIKVNKVSRLGDFVSVQKAIDSLPVFTHCRVVISISAGIYR